MSRPLTKVCTVDGLDFYFGPGTPFIFLKKILTLKDLLSTLCTIKNMVILPNLILLKNKQSAIQRFLRSLRDAPVGTR